MQGLTGVDEQALFGEGEIERVSVLDDIPAIVAARARQGSNFQVRISGRTRVEHVLLRWVRRHIWEAVGKRHQTGLQVAKSEGRHVHGAGQGQIRRTVQEAGAQMARRRSRGKVDGGGRNRSSVSSGAEQGCRRGGRRVAMGGRVLEVGLQLLELPVDYQIRITSHRLLEAVTAGIEAVTAGVQR